MKVCKKIVNNILSYLLIILGFGSCMVLKSCGCEYGPPPEVYNDRFSNTIWTGGMLINGLKYIFEIKLSESLAIYTYSIYENNKCIETKTESFYVNWQEDDIIIMTSKDSKSMLKGTIRNDRMEIVDVKTGEKICVLYKI